MNCKCWCGCPIWVSKKSNRLVCAGCDPDTTVFGKKVEPKHATDHVEEKRDSVQAWKEPEPEAEEARESVVRGRWNTNPEKKWMSEKKLEKYRDIQMADELRGRA
jgi:hypothetical protein